LSKPTTTPVTLTVTRNTEAVKKGVANFVETYNSMVNQFKSRSAFATSADANKPALSGDGTVRLMLSQLRGVFNVSASGDLTTLAQVGITTKADGTLKLDSSKLDTALADNFNNVRSLFNSETGFGTRLNAWADTALDSEGVIESRTKSLDASIKGYNEQISKLEVRMSTLKKQYTTTYSNLNTLLSNMSSTSSYLTTQLANL